MNLRQGETDFFQTETKQNFCNNFIEETNFRYQFCTKKRNDIRLRIPNILTNESYDNRTKESFKKLYKKLFGTNFVI